MAVFDILGFGFVAAAVLFGGGVFLANKKFRRDLEERMRERTRQLEEAEKREVEKARQVARLKDEFVYVAAHELRTPVTAIKGFLELVQETKNLPKGVKHNLSAMDIASRQLNQLVNDLLEVARSGAGAMKIEVRPLNLIPLLEMVVDQVSPIAEQKQVKINLDAKGEIPPVLCDSDKLKEVLMNLLSNAIKYNKKKGTVDIIAYPQKPNLIVEFRDTGYGIPKEQQEEIFQKFFRVKLEETRDVRGTGLGLFIARMLVEKMGGRIRFSSVEKKGTTFAFSLPLAV